jgi:hypothetical protein
LDSHLACVPRGAHTIKGFEGTHRVFAADFKI